MHRREFLAGAAFGALILGANKAMAFDIFSKNKPHKANSGADFGFDRDNFPFRLSDEQWRARLSPDQYYILRGEGTERSCSSPLNGVEGEGKFYCAGCGYLLFATEAKYDSKTGWPSFYQPVDDKAVGTYTDYKLIYPRTEVHCANCGSHLGHVFPDGPPPTGLRYCINGLALEYQREE